MPDPYLVSARMKEILTIKKLTKAEVADGARVEPSHVASVLRGKCLPNGRILLWLNEKYDIRATWLMDGAGPMSITLEEQGQMSNLRYQQKRVSEEAKAYTDGMVAVRTRMEQALKHESMQEEDTPRPILITIGGKRAPDVMDLAWLVEKGFSGTWLLTGRGVAKLSAPIDSRGEIKWDILDPQWSTGFCSRLRHAAMEVRDATETLDQKLRLAIEHDHPEVFSLLRKVLNRDTDGRVVEQVRGFLLGLLAAVQPDAQRIRLDP